MNILPSASKTCGGEDFKGQDINERLKVKSRLLLNFVNLHPPSNIPTKCEYHKPYGFQDMTWRRF